jgi:hypothetical protein
MGLTMTTTMNDDGFGDAEHATTEVKPPPSFADMVQRVDAAWCSKPPPSRQWLVSYQDDVDGADSDEIKRRKRGFIARGEMHLLVGEGGVGKGHVVCQLATCLAGASPASVNLADHGFVADLPFSSVLGFDVHPLRDAEKVLLLVGEDDAHEMHARIYAAAVAEKLNEEQASAVAARLRWRSYRGDATTLVDLSDDQKAEKTAEMLALLRYLDEEGPFALVIVDPYSRFVAIEENANTLQHQAAATLEAISKAPGRPAVLLVGHVSKPGGDERSGKTNRSPSQHDARGASAVVNAVRICHAMAPYTRSVIVTGDGTERPADIMGTSTAEAREIQEHFVQLATVKNNLGPKGRKKLLAWTADGGLYVENEKSQQERRARQWRGGTPVAVGKAKKPAASTATPTPSADDLEDYA